MMRGRKPEPTVIRAMRGNPSKRPLPIEPKAADGAEPPADLTPAEQRFWNEVAPLLERVRILKETDALALTALCRDLAQEEEIRQQLAPVAGPDGKLRQRLLIPVQFREGAEKGVMLNPLFRVQTELRARIQDAFRNFGMTPSARTRVSIDRDGGEGDIEDALCA